MNKQMNGANQYTNININIHTRAHTHNSINRSNGNVISRERQMRPTVRKKRIYLVKPYISSEPRSKP